MGKDKGEFDNLEIGPVTDSEGNAVDVDDVISRALAPEKVTFEFDGLTYSVWIRKTQVAGRLLNRVTAIQGKLALKAGFMAGEDVRDDDDRAGRFMELMSENEVLEAAETDIAVAATIVKDGKPLTNLPLPATEKFTRESVLGLGALGEAFVSAVREHLRPTSAEPEAGAEETPKTKKASTTAS